MKDKLYTLFVVVVLLASAILAGWGTLVLIGKLFVALGLS